MHDISGRMVPLASILPEKELRNMKRWISVFLIAFLLCPLMVSPTGQAEQMYLIAHSDSRKLTEKELWDWDYESLGYILNEIFARHGYDFIPGGQYDVYFRSLPWYTPNNSNDNNKTCYNRLNEIEWYNQELVKQVRQKMRDTKNYNTKGKSVWSNYSRGFDVLQGFGYVEFKTNQSLPVFSAPSASSWRGANGKASVSTNGAVYAGGSEKGWLMVMYETNNGGVRVGYIEKSRVTGKITGDMYYANVSFNYLPSIITENCTLTDDPARQTTQICSLRAGTQVTWLNTYINSNAWAYVETTAPDGRICRGFVPARCVDTGYEDDIGDEYGTNG